MKMRYPVVLLLLIFLLIPVAYAQQDTTEQVIDSAKNAFLQEQSRQLQKLEALRVADSLRKIELEEQLNSLKSTDLLKKEELLDQLKTLKSRDSVRLADKKRKIDSLRHVVKGYPVSPFIDTIFSVYTRSGSLSPRERADAISERIEALADDYWFRSDSLRIQVSESTTDIVYVDKIIMGISESDALWMNTTSGELAEEYRMRIAAAVEQHKENTSWQTLAKEIGLALLVVALLVLLIFFISKVFRFTRGKLVLQKGKWIRGIRIRNYELFDAEQQLRFFIRVNTVLKWLVILIVVYLSLPLLFSIFPWTEGFADTLLSYFINPVKQILLGIWNYLPNLITIIVIIIVFRYVVKGIRFLKNEIQRGALTLPGFYPDWATPTYQIVRVLVYAFMLVVIFPYLPGSDSPVFQGVSVFLGVLFTFGSTGPLSNVIAGLVLTYMRAFRVGDRVKIGEVFGDIIEKTSLVTRIRTIKNEIISIPNSAVMNSHTTNYSSDAPDKGLILHTTVTIGYDVPWRDVYALLIDAALATELIEQEPKPFVLQLSLDDFYISYQINAYTKRPNRQSTIYSELHQNIQDRFNEAGVEIMSPHYQANRDGSESTVQSQYRPRPGGGPSQQGFNSGPPPQPPPPDGFNQGPPPQQHPSSPPPQGPPMDR